MRSRDLSSPYPEILKILAEVDPEYLIEMGSPKDEYSPEAFELAEMLRAGNRLDEAQLRSCWSHYFGETSIFLRDGDVAAVVNRLNNLGA